MRRKDREVTEIGRINEIIRACDCCRLAFADGEEAYIVPLNFGYDEVERAFYFHGAKEGRKIELAQRLGRASFELDCRHELKESEKACGYSYLYQSVMGKGRIRLLEDSAQKRRGLDVLMEHFTGRSGWEYPEEMIAQTAVLRLDVEEMTAKEHR